MNSAFSSAASSGLIFPPRIRRTCLLLNAPSNIFLESKPAVHVINPDGSNQQTILDKEAFSIVCSAYDTLYLGAGNEWYRYVLDAGIAALNQSPSSMEGRLYTDNTDRKFSLWVDKRDGKGVLIRYDRAVNQENTLVERGGLNLPVYWLNEKYIIYRVADSKETADYVLNLEGGEPRKIIDVTDTSGISRWFYY